MVSVIIELLVRGCPNRVHEVPDAFTNRVHGASKLGAQTVRLYLHQAARLYDYRWTPPPPRGGSRSEAHAVELPLDAAGRVRRLNVESSLAAGRDAGQARPVTLRRALWRTVAGLARLAHSARDGAGCWQPLSLAVNGEMRVWLSEMKRWERSLPSWRNASPVAPGEAAATEGRGAPRERLTVLLLTKNEERQIEACLAGVRWADEIVVVDGESADRTIEICRRFGAKVITRPFSGSFAEERNAGLEAATGDWILQLDADERMTPPLRAAIERMLAARDERYQAYRARRRNIFLGRFMRYGGWYYDHLCLFRRGYRYHGLVHERLEIRGAISHLRAELQAEPFRSLEQFVERQNRYTTLQARELFASRGRLPWPVVRNHITRRPLTRWWKFYVKKQGFREGLHGLVFSTLYAWVEFLVWMKYCELAYPADEPLQQTAR